MGSQHLQPPIHPSTPQHCNKHTHVALAQGTNAHVILSLANDDGSCHSSSYSSSSQLSGQIGGRHQPLYWSKQHLSVAPLVHALAACVGAVGQQQVVLQARLGDVRSARLHDHVVLGRAIVPGAGFMEMAAQAVFSVAAGSAGATTAAAAAAATLGCISIPYPLQLHGAGGGSGTLSCSVNLASGALSVSSSSGTTDDVQLQHLLASVLTCLNSCTDVHKGGWEGTCNTLGFHSAGEQDMRHAVGVVDSSSGGAGGDDDAYLTHPAALDCVFQLACSAHATHQLMVPAAAQAVALPFARARSPLAVSCALEPPVPKPGEHGLGERVSFSYAAARGCAAGLRVVRLDAKPLQQPGMGQGASASTPMSSVAAEQLQPLVLHSSDLAVDELHVTDGCAAAERGGPAAAPLVLSSTAGSGRRTVAMGLTVARQLLEQGLRRMALGAGEGSDALLGALRCVQMEGGLQASYRPVDENGPLAAQVGVELPRVSRRVGTSGMPRVSNIPRVSCGPKISNMPWFLVGLPGIITAAAWQICMSHAWSVVCTCSSKPFSPDPKI